MKWEVGKYYRTEKGRKARIYATDGRHARCVHGAILLTDGWAVTSWFENGVRVLNGSSDDDLIGEWKEPTEHYRPFRMDELHSVLGSIVKTKLGGIRRQITSVGCSSDHDVWIDLTGPAGEGQRMGVEELLDNWLLEDLNGVCVPCGVLTGSCVGTSARISTEPPKYRHYSHEELKTFIGQVVFSKETGLPEMIVGMTNKVTVRLAVRETPVTALDLLVMYEWEGNLPCGVRVPDAVGDGITDDTEAMQGRVIKRGGRDQYDPSNVDGVLPSFVKPDDTEVFQGDDWISRAAWERPL